MSGTRELFEPTNPKEVNLYVCGITPYDSPHVGHGRVYVTFDILYRLLRFLGYEVTYVRNFTDVDDKLIARAAKELGDSSQYREIADKYIDVFNKNMEELGCIPPMHEPRVTDHIKEIIAFVGGLIKSGHAYVADGDVYFSIKTFDPYGKLSKRNLDDLLAGARVDVSEKKRDPLDFALWKGEAEGSFWKSPWGYGRPGWHIECSTLARLFLGDQLDIHGGGMDLIFPHHENEIAQSEALLGVTFAPYWVHNAFVRINKEKMSKSKGNFFTLDDIFAETDPMVVRYLYLQHQYRNPLDFDPDQLKEVQKSYEKLIRICAGKTKDVTPEQIIESSSPIIQKMLHFLYDDLNTPGMFGVVFEHAQDIQKDPELKSMVKTILSTILGLSLEPLAKQKVEITPEIKELIKKRDEARKRKDYTTADALRDKLRELGVDVQDPKITDSLPK